MANSCIFGKVLGLFPKMVFENPVLSSFETKTEISAADPWGKGNNGFIKSAELGT